MPKNKSKLSAYKAAQNFLEPPIYQLHDVYRALSVLAKENDLIQSEVFRSSNFLGERNSKVLYYDCSNFYFEIEQEEGQKSNLNNSKDPARFVGKDAATKEWEVADIFYYLDEERITEESKYDGLYGVCTDLLDDNVDDILKVSEGRWQIEECFRIMKTDFAARPVFVQREDCIKAHFLICFLALLNYRLLERQSGNKYTCTQLLKTLKEINFVDVEGQGFIPTYAREKIIDDLHDTSGAQTASIEMLAIHTLCSYILLQINQYSEPLLCKQSQYNLKCYEGFVINILNLLPYHFKAEPSGKTTILIYLHFYITGNGLG